MERLSRFIAEFIWARYLENIAVGGRHQTLKRVQRSRLWWHFDILKSIFIQAQEPADAPEVLTSGPIHEAYAKPVTATPAPGPVVAKQPPEPIEETPPDQKPDGQEVEWIPGYWSWDEDDKEFDWVSGFWRESPPDRDWIPGHWQEVDQGWMWVSGYWAPEKQTDVEYVPAPPPTDEAGPSTPAPDATSSYVPGIWVYQQNQFYWRPGFWIANRPDWVWNPAYYMWTTTGYIFNDGYWDHPFDNRGLLFAPVRFGPQYFAARRPFTPSYVVRPDYLFASLFIGPSFQNYFFGDYFDARYATRGYHHSSTFGLLTPGAATSRECASFAKFLSPLLAVRRFRSILEMGCVRMPRALQIAQWRTIASKWQTPMRPASALMLTDWNFGSAAVCTLGPLGFEPRTKGL